MYVRNRTSGEVYSPSLYVTHGPMVVGVCTLKRSWLRRLRMGVIFMNLGGAKLGVILMNRPRDPSGDLGNDRMPLFRSNRSGLLLEWNSVEIFISNG